MEDTTNQLSGIYQQAMQAHVKEAMAYDNAMALSIYYLNLIFIR